ncbi:MAG: ATP-binding protein [Nitrospirota bacterium]|nr:ATP-binding protein [Nitrospirota bacterium]
MIPLFTKPLNTITGVDLCQLWLQEIPEGQTVKFKETLPSKSGQDPWFNGKNSIGDYARNKILEEIVAFANAGGGNLVIGVRESSDHPKRAVELAPIPRCHELADRLRYAIRDCVDPQIPAVEVIGVSQDDMSDQGAVLIRLPQSRLAPHRLNETKECYIRRADRTEKMWMREIQDMCVDLVRGIQLVDAQFNERSQIFDQFTVDGMDNKVPEIGSNGYYGYRVTALPVGSNIFIKRPYSLQELNEKSGSISIFRGESEYEIYSPIGSHSHGGQLEPRLRSAYREVNRPGKGKWARTIHCGGLVEFVGKWVWTRGNQGRGYLYTGWVLADAANAVRLCRTAAAIGGAPSAEY